MTQSAAFKDAISNAVEKNTGPEVTPAKADAIAASSLKAIEADPVLANASNREPLVQSRIVWGGSAGVVASLLYMGLEIVQNGNNWSAYDPQAMGMAAMTTWGAAYVLYGRLWSGLKPLFWGWFGKAEL